MSLRLKYKNVPTGHRLPDLTRYRVVMFQDIRDYYGLDSTTRHSLDQHCRQFSVGILGFLPPVDPSTAGIPESSNSSQPFTTSSPLAVLSLQTLPHHLLRVLKANLTVPQPHPAPLWFNLRPGSEDVVPVVSARYDDGSRGALVLEDQGQDSGVVKIIIGGSKIINFWLIKLLVIDALHYLSAGRLTFPLTRYVLVDIDDIFVGSARLVKSDVAALLESQRQLSRLVTGFQYNLGFSGKYFMSGSAEENEGDLELLAVKDSLWWFPHMWKHLQPHRFDNQSELEGRMVLNKEFSARHQLPVKNQYSVAPHHSGVFPVHSQLYQAWRKVWDISVTSTEEYPGLRPARRRRGFSHGGVDVLPRQTCGLYTKNLYYAEYPGGSDKLENSIMGGELFFSIVTNPISIFMTHMPNYCCDRLAPYTFQSVFSFLKCHTNLQLMTQPPSKLSSTYFSLFPEERQALWSNPCDDSRHLEIWSEKKNCNKLPQVLVVGPQKTGTTALYSFLKLHPDIVSNYPSKETFEEVQFFSGRRYAEGLDWYLEQFPVGNQSVVMFEKSATYFDGENVPLRAHRLLPRAWIVVVLTPPGDRAYSWYQHMRAHNDQTATNYSFKEVLLAGADSPSSLVSLRSRCLQPGLYAAHLERWLTHYKPARLLIIDGVRLRESPVDVMDDLQRSLQLPSLYQYSDSLVFDSKKGFYCMKILGKKKCLGGGKGRKYPPMDDFSSKWLLDFYRKPNESLERLLTKLGYPVPDWLSSSH